MKLTSLKKKKWNKIKHRVCFRRCIAAVFCFSPLLHLFLCLSGSYEASNDVLSITFVVDDFDSQRNCDPPNRGSPIEELVSLSRRIDNRPWEREAEQWSRLQRPVLLPSVPAARGARLASPSTPEPRGSTGEHRFRAVDCLYCGKPGHSIAGCPLVGPGIQVGSALSSARPRLILTVAIVTTNMTFNGLRSGAKFNGR